jgi:hypothetical protein
MRATGSSSRIRRQRGADRWLGAMHAAGHEFDAYPVDVADHDSCQQCVEKIVGTSARSRSW